MTTTAAPLPDPEFERHLIPHTLLAPSPTNPRKRFEARALAELADHIALHGVQSDLLVRPHPQPRDGGPTHEIVFGERRWRAVCRIAAARGDAPIALPCKVRTLTDLEAAELQFAENHQREQLHPLEEAEGLERMLLDAPAWAPPHAPRLHGYTIAQLAQRLKMHERLIVNRLRLLGLTPEARKAWFDDELGIGLRGALVLARLNTMHQAELLAAMRHDAAKGARWTNEQIATEARARFMLRLHVAPFDLADAALLPAAGACTACPKRSGANPDLFDDIAEEDTCADRACFAAKWQAHTERARTAAVMRGWLVIEGPEARRLLPRPDATVEGHLRLDRPSDMALSKKTLAELFGSDAPGAILIDSPIGAALPDLPHPTVQVAVMPIPAVRMRLAAMKLLRDEPEADAPRAAKPAKPATAPQSAPPGAPHPTPSPATDRPAMPRAAAGAGQEIPAELVAGATAADVPRTEAEQATLDEVLDFPIFRGLSPGHKFSQDRLDAATHMAFDRVFATLAAHRIARDMQRAGGAFAGWAPMRSFARMLCLVLVDTNTNGSIDDAAALAGIRPPSGRATPQDIQQWASELDDAQAERLAIVLLALQAPWGPDDLISRFPATLLQLAGHGMPAIETLSAEAQETVTRRAQLELIAAAPKAKARSGAKASKATRAGKPAAPAAKPTQKAAAPAPAAQLSPAAAWPFAQE